MDENYSDNNEENGTDGNGAKVFGFLVSSLVSTVGCLPILVTFLAIIVFVFVFLILIGAMVTFAAPPEDTGGSNAASSECGFTISRTSLSKSEYKQKLSSFSSSNSGFKIFADNADAIYDYAVSKNVNPELVAIRALVESNGGTTGTYNYWGINCTNTGQGADCRNYPSFEVGYTDFFNIVAQYDSLAAMMKKYAYIGAYWYTLDTRFPSSDGGCYYAPYIYESNMPAHVASACAPGAPSCVMGGSTASCTATTEDDQIAYANWQVKRSMASARKTIFGLDYEDGPCTSGGSNLGTLASYNLSHNGLNVLNRSLNNGEIGDLNSYINQEVDKVGYGTGAGVAMAGQSLTYWLEKQGFYLQYYWGGGHGGFGDGNYSFVGVNSNWGSTRFGADTHSGNYRAYFGMDCSGFVSWAIRTACNPGFGSHVSGDWTGMGESLGSLGNAEPGDVLADSGHIQLIVKNNGDGTVIVAEEAGSPTNGLVFTKISSTSRSIRRMKNWYSSNCSSSR